MPNKVLIEDPGMTVTITMSHTCEQSIFFSEWRSLNSFPYTAILQQTTFRKILNVHSAEKNEHILCWKALKTLWQSKKLLLQEQFLPLSHYFQMLPAVAGVKTSIYGVKG